MINLYLIKNIKCSDIYLSKIFLIKRTKIKNTIGFSTIRKFYHWKTLFFCTGICLFCKRFICVNNSFDWFLSKSGQFVFSVQPCFIPCHFIQFCIQIFMAILNWYKNLHKHIVITDIQTLSSDEECWHYYLRQGTRNAKVETKPI